MPREIDTHVGRTDVGPLEAYVPRGCCIFVAVVLTNLNLSELQVLKHLNCSSCYFCCCDIVIVYTLYEAAL